VPATTSFFHENEGEASIGRPACHIRHTPPRRGCAGLPVHL